jgi:cytochrome b involved in lipid metabolism
MYTYRFNGPSDQGILLKNRGNNAQLDSKMAMPQKFYPSAGDSMFSTARKTFITEYGNGENILNKHSDSSQYIHVKKFNAIGKSSQLNISRENPLSFRAQDTTSRNSAIRRCRSGGCVAPKKKGALENTYKSGGSSSLSGRGNRQYIVPVRDMTILYTPAELSSHKTIGDIWIAYSGNVYNISSYVSELNSLHTVSTANTQFFASIYWGGDITTITNNQHTNTQSQTVLDMLEPYYIGKLQI